MDDKPKEEPVVEELQEEETPQEEPQEQPVKEESPDESPQEEEAETQSGESVEEEGEVAPPQISRRKAKRLEKLENLVERLKISDGPTPKANEGINYREMLDADPEVYEQLETRSKEFGTEQYNAGLEQVKSIQFHTRLEIDAPKVESKYPQFNKESKEFNPAATNAINQWYLSAVGYDPQTDTVANPNVRYSEFVDGIMELADNIAGIKTSKTRKNIAKQASSTGLRPDGSSAKALNLEKAPQDMTEEELSAVISRALPKN